MSEIRGSCVKEKWYKRRTFPIVPIFEHREADRFNASEYTFIWLLLQMRTACAPTMSFELSFGAKTGFRLSLPYLNVWFYVPLFPWEWESRLYRKGTWRKENRE